MNQKADKKKNVRPKSNVQNLDISEPFAFKHDLHIGQEVYGERQVDTTQTPSPDGSNDVLLASSSLSKVIENNVLPAIRSEIANIVEEKLRHILNEHKENSDSRHCSTCLCIENKANNKENVPIGMKDSNHANLVNETKSEERHEEYDYTKRKSVTVTESIDGEQDHFSNPTQYKDVQTGLEHGGGKLMKYGSDIQLTVPKHVERERSLGFMRTQTLPLSGHHARSKTDSEMPYHKSRPFTMSDERKCLADALQWHVEELIDSIVFKDSELPDDLLGDSCLTDEECSSLRKTHDRKDQVRVLVSIIKGRDFEVLMRFLKHIKTQNASVASSIMDKFEQNKSNGVRCSECALCNLTSNVNLKYIADRLWKHNLIEGGLFNWIVQSDRPTGVQGELWRGVIVSLNVQCKMSRSYVSGILSTALTRNNHYGHVAKGLERMISTHGELFCQCQVRPNIRPAESFLSLQSSRSPLSSEFDADSKSEVMTSHNDNTSVKRLSSMDMSGIKPQQEPQTQNDDMTQRRSQKQITTDLGSTQAVETNVISSLSHLDRTRNVMHTTTSPDDANTCYMQEEDFENKKRAESMIRPKYDNTNDSSAMYTVTEEKDDSRTQENCSPKPKYALEETNDALVKDVNTKPAVPETHRKLFLPYGRHILDISAKDLVSSDV